MMGILTADDRRWLTAQPARPALTAFVGSRSSCSAVTELHINRPTRRRALVSPFVGRLGTSDTRLLANVR